jgi:hypothetical protein
MNNVTYKELHSYFLNRAKGCTENGHLQWLYSVMTVDAQVNLGCFIGTTNVYVTNIAEDGVVTVIRDKWKNIDKNDNEAKLAIQLEKLKSSKYKMSTDVNVTLIDKETNTTHNNRKLCWDTVPPKTMYVK